MSTRTPIDLDKFVIYENNCGHHIPCHCMCHSYDHCWHLVACCYTCPVCGEDLVKNPSQYMSKEDWAVMQQMDRDFEEQRKKNDESNS
jgi:transcription initiation factor IIE alpha subunit